MKFNILIYLLGALLVLASCSKEIDPSKVGYEDEILSELIIETHINDKSDSALVYITTPKGYFYDGDYPKISGAQITVNASDDDAVVCEEQKPGYYSAYLPFKEYNTEYKMEVSYDGKSYKGASTMPSEVAIDSVSFHIPEISFGPNQNIFNVKVHLKDEGGVTNYYRLKYIVNDEPITGNNTELINDQLIDGIDVELEIYDEFFGNDTLTIVIQGIDQGTYNFYRQLQDLYSGNPSFSMPENPEGNFGPDVIGHFSAYSVDSVKVSVQDLADRAGIMVQPFDINE